MITEHEAAVRALCAGDPTLSRNGFRKAVLGKWAYTEADERRLRKRGKGAMWEPMKGKVLPHDDFKGELNFLPDAWKIGDQELHCYEIAHTSILTPRRRRFYANLWFTFDCYEIKLRLFACDTMGKPVECDLEYWWRRYAVPEMLKRLPADE